MSVDISPFLASILVQVFFFFFGNKNRSEGIFCQFSSVLITFSLTAQVRYSTRRPAQLVLVNFVSLRHILFPDKLILFDSYSLFFTTTTGSGYDYFVGLEGSTHFRQELQQKKF